MITPEPRRPRALIVEDEPMVAVFVEQVLDDIGVDAGIAGTLEAAKAAARDGAFDFAIVDLNLNGQLTFPVVDICRARGLPAVIVSGYGADAIPPDYADVPMMSKPFRVDSLIAMVERFIAAAPARGAKAQNPQSPSA